MSDAPALNERVRVHLGPQPAAQVIATLLDAARVNYVIVGDIADSRLVRTIQLMPPLSLSTPSQCDKL
jgi:hypothetical protein